MMRNTLKIWLFAVVLWACAAPPAALPTLLPSPAASATPLVVFVGALPGATASPGPATASPVLPARTARVMASPPPPPTSSPPPPTPTLLPSPTPTATPLPPEFSFGASAQGRPLVAYRFGTGEWLLMLVGGVHSGYERNTTALLERIRDQLLADPASVHPRMTWLLIPALNPDGMAQGETLAGRFNANGVDLNRNWGCGWQSEAFFREMRVSAGSAPFSEPETLALGGLIQQTQPRAVLFYHAAANGVFGGQCDNDVSADLVRVYGEASQYPYGGTFSSYPITGTAPNWVASLGIPAADVELATASDPEFVRNWRALLAVQAWIVGQAP